MSSSPAYMVLPTTLPQVDNIGYERRSSEFSDIYGIEKQPTSRRALSSRGGILLACVLGALFFFGISNYRLRSMARDVPDASGRCSTCEVDVNGFSLPLRHDLMTPLAEQTPSRQLGFAPYMNRTLGFERIYVVNMPHRRDKKAEMSLLAYHYDLDLIFVDGINGREQRPEVHNGFKQGEYGTAEAHASAWRRMLQDGASTALFFEDDVDFSVFFKDQLLRIQEPLAMLSTLISGKPTYRSPADPWNSEHWDQLWLGEETERWWTEDELVGNVTGLPYAVFRDPTRGQLHEEIFHEGEYTEILDAYKLPQHFDEADAHKRLRVLQTSFESFALSGYALTARGARKSLYKNAHKSWIDHIDYDMKELGTHGFSRQLTVVPPIFNQRKPVGGEDSDRTGESASGHVIAGKIGRTATMVNTAREHLFDNLLADRRPVFVHS